jgi:hypothetical protein
MHGSVTGITRTDVFEAGFMFVAENVDSSVFDKVDTKTPGFQASLFYGLAVF